MIGCKIYIKDIKEDSVAGADGRLQPGDVLLELNGKSLEGLSLKKTKKLLKATRKELQLIVERESEALSDKAHLIPKVMNNEIIEKKCNISPSPNLYPKAMKKSCQTGHLLPQLRVYPGKETQHNIKTCLTHLDITPTSTAVNYLTPVDQGVCTPAKCLQSDKTQYHRNIYQDL